jgi:hypothetical protein
MLNALARNAALDSVLSLADTSLAVPLVRKEAAEIIVLNTCRLDKSRTRSLTMTSIPRIYRKRVASSKRRRREHCYMQMICNTLYWVQWNGAKSNVSQRAPYFNWHCNLHYMIHSCAHTPNNTTTCGIVRIFFKAVQEHTRATKNKWSISVSILLVLTFVMIQKH